MTNDLYLKKLAKTIVETTFYDKKSGTLFVNNPGISYEALQSLAKKHNFQVAQTQEGEYASVPHRFKYQMQNGNDLNISLYDDFTETYTYYDRNYSTLQFAYKTFDLMDENLAEVGLMLDTYAAEVLSQGFVENPIKVKVSDKNAQALLDKIFLKNKIYEKTFSILRSIAKYGNYGILLSYPYLETLLEGDDPTATPRKIDVLNDLNLSTINPKFYKINVDEYYNVINYETQLDSTFVINTNNSVINNKIWQPWQFVNFSIQDEITEPYGKSMLWSMRSAFDQLTTLEALLAISRSSKVQRLAFYIPVPRGTSGVDAYEYVNEFKANYLNSIFTDQGSIKAGRKTPGAYSILCMPVTSEGTKTEISSIQSNIDLSSIEDVNYFLDKVLRNSNLSKGYLVGEDIITTAQTLEAQDLKLKRGLLPLKKAYLNGMLTLAENVLAHAGFDIDKLTTEIILEEPIQIASDTLAKYSDFSELLKAFLEVNPDMTNVNKFQFLVKLGLPLDLAKLVCSKVSLNVLENKEDLGRFLVKHKTKTGTDSEDFEEDLSDFGESTLKSTKVSSKQFLYENYDLFKKVGAFAKDVRASTAKTVLNESFLCGNKITKANITE